MKQRYIWSPECGGCLMLQEYAPDQWRNQASTDEGQFPTHDKTAKAAVKRMNAHLRAQMCFERAKKLHSQAMMTLQQGIEIQKKAGGGVNYPNLCYYHGVL
jgi:hypothetical protein